MQLPVWSVVICRHSGSHGVVMCSHGVVIMTTPWPWTLLSWNKKILFELLKILVTKGFKDTLEVDGLKISCHLQIEIIKIFDHQYLCLSQFTKKCSKKLNLEKTQYLITTLICIEYSLYLPCTPRSYTKRLPQHLMTIIIL